MRPLVALALALAACADAQSPDSTAPSPDAPASTPIEVADGRTSPSDADVEAAEAWGARPDARRAIEAAAAHWRSQDPALELDLRVLAVAEGAFTRPGAAQHAALYLVSRWPRCCPRVGLAVSEGDRLVRNVTFEQSAHHLQAVPDLDGDGLDEMALAASFGMGGSEEGSVMLAAFGPDELAVRGTLPTSASDCGTGRPGASATAARVWAEPGPAFFADRYAQASCDTEAWTPVGTREPVELAPSTPLAVVELATD